MIVRLDLHQNVDRLHDPVIDAGVRIGKIAPPAAALYDRRIVAIGGKDPERTARMGVADHREQRFLPLAAIDDPVRIEYLVAAVFGVRLREHHQLDVGGIASQLPKTAQQVFDLICRQRKPQLAVGAYERRTPRLQ